jgi:hypothetical protein
MSFRRHAMRRPGLQPGAFILPDPQKGQRFLPALI